MQQRPAKKPLVERAIAHARMLGDGKEIQTMRVYWRQYALALGVTRHKTRWTQSALALVEHVRKPLFLDAEPYGMQIPVNEHVWCEFAQPVCDPALGEVHAVFLLCTSEKATFTEAVRSFHVPRDAFQEALRQLEGVQLSNTWLLSLIGEGGSEVWNIGIDYRKDAGTTATFHPTTWYHCPTGECRTEEMEEGTLFHLCDACRRIMTYWISWFATAYLVLKGDFQEQETARRDPEMVEQTTRKVPREDKPGKFHEVAVEHRYRVVTFDATVKRQPSPPQHTAAEPRGSWIKAAQAIDPEAVLWVPKHIADYSRTYRHARYVNVRGQTQTIRTANPRRVPVKVKNIGKVMTRVIASEERS